MQQPDGIVEGWHGDGNFARTALMYGLWKTQGARLSPWKHLLRLGAVASEKESYFVLTSQTDWEGKLIFDAIRHTTILNLPVDYPRINQFPEWFTAASLANYLIMASNPKLSGTYSGAKLLEGIPIKIKEGERFIISIQRKTPLIDKRGLTKTNN